MLREGSEAVKVSIIEVVGQFDKSEVGAQYRTERGSAGC